MDRLAGVATLLVIGLVGTQRWQIGVRDEWQWPYLCPSPPNPGLPAAFFLALLALLVGWRCTAASGGAAGSPHCLPGVRSGARGNPFFGKRLVHRLYEAYDSIVAPWAGGYYSRSARIRTQAPTLMNTTRSSRNWMSKTSSEAHC